ASSILGDVIDASINLFKGAHATLGLLSVPKLLPISEMSCQYLIPLEVADEPGVLHAVSGVFATNGVSNKAAEQDGIGTGARLVFLTHEAHEAAVQRCLEDLRGLSAVAHIGAILRVIGD
ncbi:MAG: homoserine dehydrogenase, partial [Actinomycetota bacterium]